MSTTDNMPTTEELHAQIAEHERTIPELERAIGVAALDGEDTRPLVKRVATARDAITRSQAALAELERRENDAAAREREIAAAHERRRAYLWVAEYMRRAAAFLRANEAAAAAKADLLGHGVGTRAWHTAQDPIRELTPEESDLDTELLYDVPRWPPLGRAEDPDCILKFPVAEIDRLQARAEELAAAEDA